MSILARCSITVSIERDVESTYRFYKLQASTASVPAKPTTKAIPPSGWSKTEPSYTEGSTNSLYLVDLTIFTDGGFSYSDVNLSSSYEAAKQAYNKAVAAQSAASAAATAANSKNAIFYADSAPSGTHKTYDIWFDTNDDNKMYYWNGSAWTAKEFGTAAFAEECITADLLAANSVTADKIVARSITAAKIAAATITANEIAANTITADKMSVTSLSAISANLGTITGGLLKLGTNAVTELKNDGTGHIGAWNFDATKLYNGTYGSDSSVYFSTANMDSKTIGGRTGADWRLTIGSKFGVTNTGAVYTTGGAMGGWTLNADQICKSVVTGGYEYRAILNAPSSLSAATKAITIAVRTNNGSGTTGAWSYPFGVAYDGSLTATKGTLGGWSIGTNNISTTNTSGNYVTLSNGTNTNQDILVVRTGAGTTASPYVWPFYLRADGTIVATKATITGSVTATSGKIAGFDIDGNSLKNGDYIDLSAYNSTYGGARLQLGPGTGAHATLSSSQLVIYNANGVDSYITPTAIYTGGTITSYGAITAGSTIVANYNGAMIRATNPTNGGVFCGVHASESGYAGVYTNGYWNGSALSGTGRWLIYRSTADTTCVPSELYTYNEGYTSLRPVIGTNAGGAAIGVMQSSASAIGIYARWGGSATADMTGRTLACPASDIRLKKNVEDSTINALSVIDAIRIRQFDWKDKSRGHWDCGMVVDEMEKDIDPKFSIGGGEDEEGNISYKSVNTFYLQGYEVKAIQELHAEIRALKGQLKELKSKIA